MAGPELCTDIVDVYVFRRGASPPDAAVEFLQMRRLSQPMAGSWQPVMGHVESGETAVDAALRELAEETGLRPGPDRGVLALWQLESVNTYFLARLNRVMLSPCFAAEVDADSEPVPDDAHDAHRWVRRDGVDSHFIWPGQRTAIDQILRDILPVGSPVAPHLRIELGS